MRPALLLLAAAPWPQLAQGRSGMNTVLPRWSYTPKPCETVAQF